MARDIGIDLGTANTLVHVSGKGIIIREPSVVAINKNTNEVLAVGDAAKRMIGRTPGSIVAIRPLKDGVIADFDVTEQMLRYFIKKAMGMIGFGKPNLIICVPSGVTEVEYLAVEEAAERAGAKRKPLLFEEPLLAAIGAGLPIDEATGCMVVEAPRSEALRRLPLTTAVQTSPPPLISPQPSSVRMRLRELSLLQTVSPPPLTEILPEQ